MDKPNYTLFDNCGHHHCNCNASWTVITFDILSWYALCGFEAVLPACSAPTSDTPQ